MKRGVVPLLVLAGIIAVLWVSRAPDTEPHSRQTPPPGRVAPPVQPTLPDKPTLLLPIAAEAEKLKSPDQSAAEDIAILDALLGEYRRHLDENPVGDNPEITAALLGRNPKRLALLPPADPAYINSAGELTDRWGSPYFFHAISGTRMEIQSAGPDREWHTIDDVRTSP